MLSRHQIQKIVKQAYPSGMFISGEQKQLRKILMQDIMSDLEQNPDITYQEAAAHYIDTAELASVNEQPHLPKRIGILIGITLVIIVLCILLYVISNQFTPPTYYFRAPFLLFFDRTVNSNGHYLPRNKFSTFLKCFLCRHLKTSAARHFHSHDCHRPDVIICNDLFQFFTVIHSI